MSASRSLNQNAHVNAFWDHVMDEILSCLLPVGEPAGWADWSRAAAQGEW